MFLGVFVDSFSFSLMDVIDKLHSENGLHRLSRHKSETIKRCVRSDQGILIIKVSNT